MKKTFSAYCGVNITELDDHGNNIEDSNNLMENIESHTDNDDDHGDHIAYLNTTIENKGSHTNNNDDDNENDDDHGDHIAHLNTTIENKASHTNNRVRMHFMHSADIAKANYEQEDKEQILERKVVCYVIFVVDN